MSFTQGLSGLNSASKDLEVVGNNVANVNTIGFKGSRAQFADVFAASLGGAGTSQIGIGGRLATVAQQFSQGNISVTNNPLDMAINGPGFFVLNGVSGTGYSRNGQFQVDKNGNITSSTGQFLQGYPATSSGAIISGGVPSNLQISTASILPTQTSSVTVGLNLDSRFIAPTIPFDPTNTSSFNKSTSTTTYDSLGNAQVNSIYFVKAPVVAATSGITAATTNLSTTATVTSTAGLAVGQLITSANFPAGTTIASITNDTTFVASAAATATSAAVAIQFGPAATTAVSGKTGTVALPGGTTGLVLGQAITGGGFPAGSVITSIPSSTTFTSSQAATGAAAAVSFGTLTGNAWNVFITVSDPNAATGVYLSPNPTPGASAWVAAGKLAFSTNGTYDSTNSVAPSVPSFTPAGASAQTLAYNFTSATQFGAAFGITKLTQNGNTSGSLGGFSTSADGTIIGRYSNGLTKALGRVALATFANNQGLQPLGDNVWAETGTSGGAVVGEPGSGINGVLQTAAVEDSSVDLTAELVNMITAQRNYQANAQTIKTQDALMQTLVNLR